ncbi:MAG TPA: HAD-IA family hydrolase [Candidatus Limnocylindrales bacterium]|nr:HAD-IA family hydrolase [Candidatus Limnocylindrales bacterium]
MTDLDYGAFDALTFDCYGTLIDWESGILAGLRAGLAPHGVDAPDEALLEAYAASEAKLESGPYLPYRTILAVSARSVSKGLGVAITDDEAAAFGGSVGDWPAFPDSTRSLRRLRRRFKLGVLTNCDDDLFAASSRRLDVEFDWVVTAQQIGSYKPNPHNFEALRERLHQAGIASARILHVAQSLYHDHVPARRLGLSTVWIDRRHDRPGSGATPVASARPNATFVSMAEFADAATAR